MKSGLAFDILESVGSSLAIVVQNVEGLFGSRGFQLPGGGCQGHIREASEFNSLNLISKLVLSSQCHCYAYMCKMTLVSGFHHIVYSAFRAVWSPSQYPKRRLFVRSRKVSKQRDLYLELSDRSEIWQALRQQCCRCACQISKRYDNLKY